MARRERCAITTFVTTALRMWAFSRRMRADERFSGLAGYTRWSGVLVLALFLVLGVFAIEDGAPLHLWVGLVQRIVVAVWFIWMMVTARRLTAGVRHG